MDQSRSPLYAQEQSDDRENHQSGVKKNLLGTSHDDGVDFDPLTLSSGNPNRNPTFGIGDFEWPDPPYWQHCP
jgi:hypothetical protein